jgi:hypothetical protein
MILESHGTDTSLSEITNIGPFGFWILVDDREYFVPFDDYPVFKKRTLEEVFNVRRLSPTQLHWPDLDADIELDALENPEKYTLIYRD